MSFFFLTTQPHDSATQFESTTQVRKSTYLKWVFAANNKEHLFIFAVRTGIPSLQRIGAGAFSNEPFMELNKTVHRKLISEEQSFYFSYPGKNMITLISKGNGKNYYGLDSEGVYHEIVRMRGLFYRTKFVLGEGLRPIGDPLKHSEFTLIE